MSSNRRKVDLALLIVVLVTGFFASQNAEAIGDWWHGLFYEPPAEIAQLAEDAGMNDMGKKLFYRFEPLLVDQTQLNVQCHVQKLGCTAGRKIYILLPENKGQYFRTIVTASHEMLHVAYSRTKPEEIDRLKILLKEEIARPEADDLNTILRTYDDKDRYNEAHSYIGSQSKSLEDDLESYYSKYFIDRSKTVNAFTASPESL